MVNFQAITTTTLDAVEREMKGENILERTNEPLMAIPKI